MKKKYYCLDCGCEKSKKGKYCKKCRYKHATRPSGLKYEIKKENKAWYKKGNIPFIKGKQISEEVKKILSEKNRGKHSSPATEFIKGLIPWNKGLKLPQMSGENHPNWKGGVTELKYSIRHIFEYRQWRSDIFTRDDFTCQECGKKGCYLEAHHIKEFYKILEENNIKTLDEALNCQELWNINNGQTLCKTCHDKTKNGKPKKQ
jgi:hypothetical protein